MKCPECGCEIETGNLLCNSCGLSLSPQILSHESGAVHADLPEDFKNNLFFPDHKSSTPGNRRPVDVKQIKKGSFFRRALALYLDLLLQGVLLLIFFMAGISALRKGLNLSGREMGIEDIALVAAPLFLIGALLNMTYFIFFHWAGGRTPGKKLNNLKVITLSGDTPGLLRSFIRWAGYSLSALPFLLGFLLVLIDDQKQALHDKIAGTYVVDASAWKEAGGG